MNIPKINQTLKERGLPENSFFRVIFADGQERTEHDSNWSDFSEKRMVEWFGQKRFVRVCKLAIKKIQIFHEGLEATIEVPEGCEAYQAIRSESTIVPGVHQLKRVLGRMVGIVRGDEVIEELYLNALESRVEGMRK